jgi:hypothetical protein
LTQSLPLPHETWVDALDGVHFTRLLGNS